MGENGGFMNYWEEIASVSEQGVPIGEKTELAFHN
jgi:hypothetical protein